MKKSLIFKKLKNILLYLLLISSLTDCSHVEKILFDNAIQSKHESIGLTKKVIQLNENTSIVYLEHIPTNSTHKTAIAANNNSPVQTIVLLHGFSGEKDNWLPVAEVLAPRYRLIIPDLLGHGESSSPDNGDYTFQAQTRAVNTFIEKLHLDKFHLIGHSMGGTIAMLYAQEHSEHIQTLTLVSPAIINANERSDYFKLLEQGKNVLIMKKPGDINVFTQYVFAHPPFMLHFVKHYFENRCIQRAELNKIIFNDLLKDKKAFSSKEKIVTLLSRLKMPVYLYWGDKDKIFDIQDSDIFKESIPQLQFTVIHNTGHGVPTESGEKLGKLYLTALETKL